MGSSGEETRIRSLLEREDPFLVYSDDGSKVVCTLNNHELPLRIDALESFVGGRKYQRLKKNKCVEDWTDAYRPFLVPSVNYSNMLFCALTNHLIKKSKDAVDGHLRGKKFANAKEKFQNDLLELYEEPTIEEMEEAIKDMEEDEEDDVSLEFVEDTTVNVDAEESSPQTQDNGPDIREQETAQKKRKPGSHDRGKNRKKRTQS